VKRDYFKDDIEIFSVTKSPLELFESLGLRHSVQSSSSSEAGGSSDDEDDAGRVGASCHSAISNLRSELSNLRESHLKDHQNKNLGSAVSPPRPTGLNSRTAPAAPPLASPHKATMLKSTIMVQNVSGKAERQDLISMFQSCGSVCRVYFYINQQGERSGSALVEFSDPAGADAALNLNSSNVVCMGEQLQLSPSNITILAMEQLDHDVRLQNIDPDNCLVAYVSNLPPNTKEEDILHLFRSCGSIVSAKIVFPTLPTPAPPFVKVTFSSSLSCKMALELDGTPFRGSALAVDYAPPAHCSVSPPPALSSKTLLEDDDDDDRYPMGFQWLEGLPGTPLCPKSKEHKDCTVEFTHYFLEPSDDVSRQGRFVSRAKVNGNNYTKNVYFRGFKWEGREVRVGDVIMLEANDAEWIARVEKCWEERANLGKPQNNRRLVSLMWYYHKKDLIDDLSTCKKKLDQLSKQRLKQVWDDGNELLFSDHLEEEQDIGSITGTVVTIVGSETEYSDFSKKMMGKNSRLFLQRFTYEKRCRVVDCRHSLIPLAADLGDTSSKVSSASAAGLTETIDNGGKRMPKKRSLTDVELDMDRAAGKSKNAAVSDAGKAAGRKKKSVTIVADDYDSVDIRPLKTQNLSSSSQLPGVAQRLPRDYIFQNWFKAKNDLLAYMSKLDALSESPRSRDPSLLSDEIGRLMSAIDERMPSYKDLQQTQVHVILRQFYKKHPENNNSNLARSVWSRWKLEFERQSQQSKASTAAHVAPAPAASVAAASATSETAKHSFPSIPREKIDSLRTGMKSRILRALKDQAARIAPTANAGFKPDRLGIVGEEIERGVYVEYQGAGEQYKRHIELLLSCLSSNIELVLHLLQGCIDISSVVSAFAFKDAFMDAQRTGVFVSKQLRAARQDLPDLPVLGGAATTGQAAVAEPSANKGEGRSRIMAALADEENSQARSEAKESEEGGWGGWSLKDESFDYGV
jgi:RNA recognition motif-containing protein